METKGEAMADARARKFKSYYVVWKLAIGAFQIVDPPGLNRTM